MTRAGSPRVGVVGAGIVGLAIAEELSRRGASIRLFEREPSPGTEASSAAAGILAPQGEAIGPGPFLDLLLSGFQLISETIPRLEAFTGIDLRYRASGMLGIALTEQDERELQRQLDWQREAGMRAEKLDARTVRSLEPALDGPIRWAVWWPQTSQLDNIRMIEAYRALLERRNVEIRFSTPVRRFLIEAGRVAGVETARGSELFDWVVNCAGPWSGFDAELPFPVPTVPVKGQILRYRTGKPLVRHVIKSPRAYLVQRADDQLIAGTTVERAVFDKSVTQEGRAAITAGVRELVSSLETVPVESSWAGLRPGTPDNLPILGPTPLDRLLLATGHYRNGILLAPLTARVIADLITEGRSPIDLSPFSVTRFAAAV